MSNYIISLTHELQELSFCCFIISCNVMFICKREKQHVLARSVFVINFDNLSSYSKVHIPTLFSILPHLVSKARAILTVLFHVNKIFFILFFHSYQNFEYIRVFLYQKLKSSSKFKVLFFLRKSDKNYQYVSK